MSKHIADTAIANIDALAALLRDMTTRMDEATGYVRDGQRTRDGDPLDFHELAVWRIKEALEAAFAAGQETK